MNMKYIFSLFVLIAGLSCTSVFAQRNVTPAIDRDPIMEQDAKHNLDVAWQAFQLKKAYKGVIMRFDETFAAYPNFSKMDEFLYLAGMSSYYLSENKGKQKIDLKTEKEKEKYAPAKLKEDAVAYLSMLVDKYPESKYRDEAEKALTEIKGKTGSVSQSN
jgi:outer membrane protein assembly factor BamD (BamD/ComL family)